MKKLYLFFQVLPVVVFAFFFASNVSAQIVVTEDNAYNESFEGLGLSNWITEAVEGETVWEASYGESHSGSKSVSYSYGLDLSGLMGGGDLDFLDLLGGGGLDLGGLGEGGSARIISPVLDLSSLGNQTTLTFYRKQVSSMAQLVFTVFYRTSPSGQWIELGRYTNATEWSQESLTLPSISSTYQISFVGSVDLSGDIDLMSLLMGGGLGGLLGGGGSMDVSSAVYLDDVYIGNTPDNGTGNETVIAERNNTVLTISPNPTTGLLRCNFNNELTNARLQLFDIFGKLLIEQPVTENTIALDLSDRASGVYFVRVISDNKVVTTQKVVRR